METIKSRKDFLELYRSGKKKSYSSLIVFYRKAGEGRRFGFAVPKSAGKATRRNTIKRRMRELIRQKEGRFPNNTSYVLVVARGSQPGFREMEEDLLRFIEDVNRAEQRTERDSA